MLETTAACAAVVGWQNKDYIPDAFGAPTTGGIINIVGIEGYIRDENNPREIMKESAGFVDLLFDTLISTFYLYFIHLLINLHISLMHKHYITFYRR